MGNNMKNQIYLIVIFLCIGSLFSMEHSVENPFEEVCMISPQLKKLISEERADKIEDLLKKQHFSSQELTNALGLTIKDNKPASAAVLLHSGVAVNQLVTIAWPPLVQAPPLYLAAFYRNPLLVKWLLIFGADPNLKLPVPFSTYDAIYNCNRERSLSHSPLELAQGWGERKDQKEAENEAFILHLLTLPSKHFQRANLKQKVK